MPSYGIHPQSLLMETTWICSWFERILKFAKQCQELGTSHEDTIYIADRSPFSAVLYCHYGELLKPVIKQQMAEVKQYAGIDIYSILIKVQGDVLWERIQNRLELEPDRALYKEDSRDWMEKVSNFYEGFDEWDLSVDNTEEDVTMQLRGLMHRTLFQACDLVPALHDQVRKVNPGLYTEAMAAGAIDNSETGLAVTKTKKDKTVGEGCNKADLDGDIEPPLVRKESSLPLRSSRISALPPLSV